MPNMWKAGLGTAKLLSMAAKGRTIRKVMGGGGGEKTKKKFMQGKMPRKKIRAKKKVKKKNSCRRKVQFLDLT